jgi:2-polyprenyl-6-methoxyphenol hydroxylase-like FAD-dependent oxidoreductase
MHSSITSRKRYDVIVIGARCAGAATAMLLARSGMRVLMVDRDAYGTDTLSTHALMRTGVAMLHRWGVLPEVIKAGTPPVRSTTFTYEGEKVVVDVKPGQGVDALYAPRRTVLDSLLVDAATAAGAEVRYGVLLTDLLTDATGRVFGAVLRGPDGQLTSVNADLVIGADGRQSTVARLVDAPCYAQSRHKSSAVFGYFTGVKDDGYCWHYRPGANIGIIPTNDGAQCVFVLVPPARFRETFGEDAMTGFLKQVAASDPDLGEQVRAEHQEGRLYRFGGALGHMRQSHGRGWALVGDAGYFKDPITAHGITDALRDAELLSRAVVSADPNALPAYQSVRDDLSRLLFETTDAIASFEWGMDEIKAHHVDLNKAMKAELAYMLEEGPYMRMAA